MEKISGSLPDPGENRPQQPSRGGFPDHQPQHQTEKTSEPQITPADAEHEIQPDPESRRQKQQIGQIGAAPPQRAEKAMPQPQNRPQQQTAEKPLGGNCRYRHPKSRRQPLSLGSS